jgi:hypothetical protein
MHEKYLGDSYDLVKRFLCQTLSPIARLYAHWKFVSQEIQEKYTTVTTIPILGSERPQETFGLLLDPDTGFTQGRATSKHVSPKFMTDVNNTLRPEYIVCFDQSSRRIGGHGAESQREQKMKALQAAGLSSFDYASHAPFLFAAQNGKTLDYVLQSLRTHGINERLFQLPKTD